MAKSGRRAAKRDGAGHVRLETGIAVVFMVNSLSARVRLPKIHILISRAVHDRLHGSTVHRISAHKNLAAHAAVILLRLILGIWNAAGYCTRVSLPCTLA